MAQKYIEFDSWLLARLAEDAEEAQLYLQTALEEFQQDGEIYYLALAFQRVASVQDDTPIWLKELSVNDIATRLGSANAFNLPEFTKLLKVLGYRMSLSAPALEEIEQSVPVESAA